jgi:hypothetical protein
MIKNTKMEYGTISHITGYPIHNSGIDAYNQHVAYIDNLLHFHAKEDNSLSGKELTLALDCRHRCFIAISKQN